MWTSEPFRPGDLIFKDGFFVVMVLKIDRTELADRLNLSYVQECRLQLLTGRHVPEISTQKCACFLYSPRLLDCEADITILQEGSRIFKSNWNIAF